MKLADDAQGQRFRNQIVGGTAPAVYFAYDLQGQLLGEYTLSGSGNSSTFKPLMEYIWLEGQPVAAVRPTPGSPANAPNSAQEVFYLHTDHLGTPRVALDTAGRVRWRWMGGEPFGLSPAETTPTAGLSELNISLRLSGQQYDGFVGLHYNYFRVYDPTVGRYVQSDPIGLGGGINTYSYVEGTPLNLADPLGLATTCVGYGLGVVCRKVPDVPVIDPRTDLPSPASTSPSFNNPFNGIFSKPGSKDTSSSSASSDSKAEQCKPECDAARSRNEAMLAAHSWAGISIGGAGANPIPWSNFNMPAGMSRGGREYGEFMRTYYPKNYGYSTPTGASVVEHPFGHPDQPGPAHHACPHFHAKNAAGVEKLFTYKPGS